MTPPSWKTRLWGVLLVNLATVSWASNAVLGRLLRSDIGPLTLTALRMTVAAAFFSLLLLRLPRQERALGRDKWWILGMALTGVVLFGPLLYLGLHYTTVVNSSLIQGLSPLFTALLAGVLIGEPVTARQAWGAVLGLLGVVGLISGGSPAYLRDLELNPGDLILLTAALAWAVYSVFGRRVMRTRSALAATALSAIWGLPILFATAAVELEYIPVHFTLKTVAAIIHICVVPTIIGFWAWNQAVRLLGAGGAMAFYNTLPLYGVVMGAALLDEALGPTQWIFGGLILAGGAWGTLGGGPKAGEAEPAEV